MHPKCFKWTWQKNKSTHRHIIIFSLRPKNRDNNSGTNGKPHQLKNYRVNILIQRPSQYGWTGINQLNVQQTLPLLPGLGKTFRNWHNMVYYPQIKIEGQKVNLCESIMLHKTSENRDDQNKTHYRRKFYRISRQVSTPTS